MRKQSLEFLKRLLATPSPSGFETEIQTVVKDYAKQYVEHVYKDVHGNQFHVRNKDAKVRIMLAGHVDEIGLQVNYIDERGFLSVVPIGGVDASVLDGQRVQVHAEKGVTPGVIGRKAIHLMDQEERGKAMKMYELWIDIGVKDQAEAQKHVAVGDPVTIDAGFLELRNNNVVARALDDRIGAFVVIEAMRLLAKKKLNVAVYCVTTVQEEIGLRGATTSSYGVNPHAGIAVDVSHALDSPLIDPKRYGATQLGGGPILSKGANINPIVLDGLLKQAKSKKIPYQIIASPRGTGTDANAMQLSRGGVATGLIGVPNRYMHSPVEMVNLDDVVHCSELIAAWIESLKPSASFIP